jgi:hypothetical protein
VKSPTLKIGQTGLGVFFVYAKSPLESFQDTRDAIPAMRAARAYDMVDEDESALRERYAHLLILDGEADCGT